jgi:hypothetical protein
MNTHANTGAALIAVAISTMKVQLGAVGMRTKWVSVTNFAAASRACRSFIEAHDLGASRWRGGPVVDVVTKAVVATVSYNGRVWFADGSEAQLSTSV